MQGGADLLYVLNAPIKMRWTKNYSPYLALKTIHPRGTQGAAPTVGQPHSIIAQNQGSTRLRLRSGEGIAEWKPLSKSWSS